MCLNVSEIIFWIIFVSKRFDAGKSIIYFSKIDFEKCFLVNRTKQPEGCIGISEKCVFVWKSLLVRGLGGETPPPPLKEFWGHISFWSIAWGYHRVPRSWFCWQTLKKAFNILILQKCTCIWYEYTLYAVSTMHQKSSPQHFPARESLRRLHRLLPKTVNFDIRQLLRHQFTFRPLNF